MQEEEELDASGYGAWEPSEAELEAQWIETTSRVLAGDIALSLSPEPEP